MASLLLLKLFKYVKIATQVGVSFGALLLLGLYTFQCKLIYPSGLNDGRGHCATPDEYDMPNYELVYLETDDKERLQCFLLKHDPLSPNYSNKTVLILSPNAGNIGHALPIVSLFYNKFGYNVFIYSYRGYGKSSGSPSEKGLKLDAQRVVKHLTEEDTQYMKSSVILYGRSLGGAVAIYISATMSKAVLGLILENTFLSIRKCVPHIFPLLRFFTMFVHQRWELEQLLSLIPDSIPVLLLSARKDEIVPPEHMDHINQTLNSTYKEMHTFPDSDHNDTVCQRGYWEIIHEFIKQNVNPVGY